MSAERAEHGQFPLPESLRYQAPPSRYSFSSQAPNYEIVGYRRKQFSEEEAYQRKLESNSRYLKTKEGKDAQDRYFKSAKGRAAMAKASRNYRERKKEQ